MALKNKHHSRSNQGLRSQCTHSFKERKVYFGIFPCLWHFFFQAVWDGCFYYSPMHFKVYIRYNHEDRKFIHYQLKQNPGFLWVARKTILLLDHALGLLTTHQTNTKSNLRKRNKICYLNTFKVSNKKKKKFAINLMSELSTHSRNQSVNKSFALQYNTKQVGVLLGNITKQNSYMARNLNTCNETC